MLYPLVSKLVNFSRYKIVTISTLETLVHVEYISLNYAILMN